MKCHLLAGGRRVRRWGRQEGGLWSKRQRRRPGQVRAGASMVKARHGRRRKGKKAAAAGRVVFLRTPPRPRRHRTRRAEEEEGRKEVEDDSCAVGLGSNGCHGRLMKMQNCSHLQWRHTCIGNFRESNVPFMLCSLYLPNLYQLLSQRLNEACMSTVLLLLQRVASKNMISDLPLFHFNYAMRICICAIQIIWIN